jgi:hypothetical protein
VLVLHHARACGNDGDEDEYEGCDKDRDDDGDGYEDGGWGRLGSAGVDGREVRCKRRRERRGVERLQLAKSWMLADDACAYARALCYCVGDYCRWVLDYSQVVQTIVVRTRTEVSPKKMLLTLPQTTPYSYASIVHWPSLCALKTPGFLTKKERLFHYWVFVAWKKKVDKA